ncbi:MAG: hypothetical protein CMO64_05095 [Verrucomicrobiales bacterium]|nr:hypothetical protein [Verrucomicrobiales bacterium]
MMPACKITVFSLIMILLMSLGCMHESMEVSAEELTNKAADNNQPAPSLPLAFQLPTTNRALLAKGGEQTFFTKTGPEKHWSSGAYGCVRNSGGSMHEGIDIRSLSRDKAGEAIDTVMAAAPGKVAFANRRSGASSYGKYLVLLHEGEKLEVYTLYAHLKSIETRLLPGVKVAAGEVVGVMGRTANHDIPKERAHLHFEIGFVGSRDFDSWMKRHYKDPNFNKFGNWHGYNLLGLDPSIILRARSDPDYQFATVVAGLPELMRLRVRGSKLPLALRLSGLMVTTPHGEIANPAGYEIAVNANGTPIRIHPLPKWPGTTKARYELASVNNEIATKHRCRKLIFRKGAKWVLMDSGHKLADLLSMGASD